QRYNTQHATFKSHELLQDDNQPIDAIIEQLHDFRIQDSAAPSTLEARDVDELTQHLASVTISDTKPAEPESVDESQSSITADESQFSSQPNNATEFMTPKKNVASAAATPTTPVSPGFVLPSPTSKGIAPPSPFVAGA